MQPRFCKESRVIPIPDSMGLDEAAAMPVTYLTAHHMLHYLAISKKKTVLIHGGAGGVGTAALNYVNGLE